ncbi:helix-turn-helix domain-containing protein [Pseudomonas aeruginosa]|uniref:helix-turn-helix domain-containing protein n=1 Tax=Pseudomonas aeruginosa TaxID=287 RepID=UPI001ABC7852|nr:LysR family transcriptional regulator [Pseudomonas aeruginosa]
MALSESAGQRPALLRPAQGRDDRAYWHELFGSLEVVHFFLVTARCGCFMQAARSLDVKPTLLRKTLARLEERLGLHLFVHEGNALSLTREGRIVQAAGQRLVEDSQSHADLPGNSRWCAWRWPKASCTMCSVASCGATCARTPTCA